MLQNMLHKKAIIVRIYAKYVFKYKQVDLRNAFQLRVNTFGVSLRLEA